MNTRKLGRIAEDLAASFLRLVGHEILARNYISRGCEVDIVSRAGGRIIFIEVKLRRTTERGLPREAVDARKRRRIAFAARGFLAERGCVDCGARFDVVEVWLSPDSLFLEVRHIAGAFGLDW